MSNDLLNSQKNQVYDAIIEAGFEPNEFEWGEASSSTESGMGMVPALFHRPSGYKAVFDYSKHNLYGNNGRVLSVWPGEASPAEYALYDNWPEELSGVSFWLANIKREINQPDLWSGEENKKFTSWAKDNKPFTVKEQTDLQARLDRIETMLVEQAKQTKQVAEDIRESLDNLRRASEKIGRKDWAMMLFGYIFSKSADWGLKLTIWHEIIKHLTTPTLHT
ncbi:MAG: hypothetical protein WAW63_00035 [Candidatus Saccharimonadales bacterium]